MEKNWKRKECDGCKSYNQECRLGVCCLYPYKKKEAGEKENYDSS